MPDTPIPNAPAPATKTVPPAAGTPRSPTLIALAALGVLCALFLVLIVVFWAKIGDRDTSLVEARNRLDQSGASIVVFQAKVAADATAAARLQKQMDDVTAASALRVGELDKIKAGDVDLQANLDKARAAAAGFQTQMEAAKVASLKSQGDVAVADARTAVVQASLDQAAADAAHLKARLEVAQGENAELQARLAKDEKLISSLPPRG